MDEKLKDDPGASTLLKKNELSSQRGIQFRKTGDRSFLDIPNQLVRSLVVGTKFVRDAINKLHAEVFNGSYIICGDKKEKIFTR